MSIELLPPDRKKTTGRYHVETNYCNCHPETCCCNDWALKDKDGNKVTTFYSKQDAQKLADKLNKLE